MSDLFDLQRQRPGIRLNRLEIFNWGTFDSSSGEVYVATPQGRTALLVGRNGSGKSTLVDAILTLLVPNAIRNYNVAAGAGKTERTERTYVLGACDQQLGEDETQVNKRYLRKGSAFYSALLAYFHDEHAASGFTIAQVLYPRADGSVDKVFLYAEGEKSIAGDLAGLTKSDGLLTALKARGFRATKTFSEYHGWFVRRTRVRPLAIDMFNQTVAVKDIRSLNAFIRNHMLEASGGRERVLKLIEHFAELRTAHRQLLRIRKQQELLLPVEKFGQQYHQFSQQLHHAERLRDAADAFFRLATVRLATPQVQRLQTERKEQETRRDALKQQIDEAAEEARKLKNEIDLAGGDRLREIPNLIRTETVLLNQKAGRRAELSAAMRACGRAESIDNAEQFAELHHCVSQRRGEITTLIAKQQPARDELVIQRGRQRQQREWAEELEALNKRRTNLPDSLAKVRAMICDDLRLEQRDLPFAAELIALTSMRKTFRRTMLVCGRVREVFPELETWLADNVRRLDQYAEVVDSLIAVSQALRRHPMPDCYVRELHVPVDTKFIEQHESTLRHWLDRLLPAAAIRVEERSFSRRYGLRDGLPHYLLRVLDETLLAELSLPFDELSLPMRHLAALPVADCTVIIAENRTNLLTLPRRARTLALGGVGDAVTRLRDVTWLGACDLVYWGDIDVDGFRILRNLRQLFPNLKSLMMNPQTLADHRDEVGTGNGKTDAPSTLLTKSENEALAMCSDGNLRLEQEKIPQQYAEDALAQT